MPNRSLFRLPPTGSSYWLGSDADDLPLIYLSWGTRFYGDQPMFQTEVPGWTYFFILQGAPRVSLGAHTQKLGKGTGLIIPPQSRFGLEDMPGARSQMISWVWREGPSLKLKESHAIPIRLAEDGLRKMDALHRACRGEIQASDAYLAATLAGYKLIIDAHLARLSQHGSLASRRQRIRLATEWMEGHLALDNCVARAAEYLSISRATLNRLFTIEMGVNPQAYLLERKMLQAQRLLKLPDMQIKEVAYRLGYKHASDFTRAFKTRWGTTPGVSRANQL